LNPLWRQCFCGVNANSFLFLAIDWFTIDSKAALDFAKAGLSRIRAMFLGRLQARFA
jgi:hypothetical protein